MYRVYGHRTGRSRRPHRCPVCHFAPTRRPPPPSGTQLPTRSAPAEDGRHGNHRGVANHRRGPRLHRRTGRRRRAGPGSGHRAVCAQRRQRPVLACRGGPGRHASQPAQGSVPARLVRLPGDEAVRPAALGAGQRSRRRAARPGGRAHRGRRGAAEPGLRRAPRRGARRARPVRRAGGPGCRRPRLRPVLLCRRRVGLPVRVEHPAGRTRGGPRRCHHHDGGPRGGRGAGPAGRSPAAVAGRRHHPRSSRAPAAPVAPRRGGVLRHRRPSSTASRSGRTVSFRRADHRGSERCRIPAAGARSRTTLDA